MELGKILVFQDPYELADSLGRIIPMMEEDGYPPDLIQQVLTIQGELVVEKYLMDREALQETRRTVLNLLGE